MILWTLLGAMYDNPDQAIRESLRVYFLYMWIYFLLTLYVSNINYNKYTRSVISFAALSISVICFYTLADSLFSLNWLSSRIKEEMMLGVGLHKGYTELSNVNVGMFCFLAPFLLSNLLIDDFSSGIKKYLVPLITFVAVLLSSRRIVFVLLFITPVLTFFFYKIVGNVTRKLGRRVLCFYLVNSCIATCGLIVLYYYDPTILDGFISRCLDIFIVDPESVRQQQFIALLEGFYEYPLIGSGFGGLTGVIRSTERPWTFELTYPKTLFNFGIFGVFLLFSFFLYYIYLAFKKIHSSNENKKINVSLMVGFFCILIASASNPYLSSFDYVFTFSIIPLILNSDNHFHQST